MFSLAMVFASSRLDIVKHISYFQGTAVAYSFVGETLKCFKSRPEMGKCCALYIQSFGFWSRCVN